MLQERLKNHKIILASGSPRRQQFLKDLKIDFEVRLKEIDESYPPDLTGSHIPDYLSELKADAYELEDDEILITGDTIVWHEGKPLEKPESELQAYTMIKSLAEKTHQVISSLCVKTIKKTIVVNDSAFVKFRALTDDEIIHYVKHYQPMDKAGAYGIQEWIGLIGVTGIEGSFFTVMGLPTHLLYKALYDITE
ncbi:Maf-like protein [Gangjinia marincola]|uniref:dTTP/UTP pyrophosphatase n=1 Tax=Gangjinia marincola TaxID=578463 RepID=A0ABN1MCV9_9FLAO